MEAVAIKQKSDIHMTKEYDMFKRVQGNREIYPNHVKALTEAFKGKPNILSYNPILVNEKMQVIDGQHRLLAAKKLDIPVYYISHKNLGLKDIQALNSGTKPWGPMDYAQSYIELGKIDYQLYVDFAEEYPFNHDILRHILSEGRCNYHMFKAGKFQMYKTLKATEFFDKCLDFKDFYSRYTDRNFVFAFRKMWENAEYNHANMTHQLAKEENETHDYFEMTDYLRELESIYNSGLKPENKVRFF